MIHLPDSDATMAFLDLVMATVAEQEAQGDEKGGLAVDESAAA